MPLPSQATPTSRKASPRATITRSRVAEQRPVSQKSRHENRDLPPPVLDTDNHLRVPVGLPAGTTDNLRGMAQESGPGKALGVPEWS